MKLLFAAFLFIGLGSLVQGEVIKDLKIPNDRFHFICQTQTTNPEPKMTDCEYVTLYDTVNRIPVYSLYKYYKRAPGTEILRKTTWKIEPQLDGGVLPYMTTEAKSDVKYLGKKQAVNDDYEESHYDRGHLYPVNHAHDQYAADGTFTLTNAAPQTPSFNKEWYNKVEKVVSKELDKCPNGNAYVVTGVKPGNEYINGRVNVPSYFWTAYCCKGCKNFSHAFIMYEDLRLEHMNLIEFQKYTNMQPFGGKCV